MSEITNIPIHKRRIIIVASDDDQLKIKKKIDWSKFLVTKEDIHFYKSLINHKKERATDSRSVMQKFKDKFNDEFKDGFSYFYKDNPAPFPVFEIDEVVNKFTFPPQHPKDGLVYACCDIEPNLYLPLAIFHTYMYQSKLSAFNEMCAALGAKTCKIIYAEENGKNTTSSVKLDNIPGQFGTTSTNANLNIDRKSQQGSVIYLELPKPKKILPYDSLWLNTEPSWVSLQKIRLNNDILKYTADLNYTDEMGVDTKLAASINSIGIDIGGTFKEIIKTRYKFEVEFWPKDDIA